MTPFDPVAWLAMMLTFYPSVTRTSLARAMAERPSYFAGGRLIGSVGDKLLLPDGRVFDIVFSAWTAASRWQTLDVTNAGPGDFEWFPLEPGPLVEIDPDATLPPLSDPVFEPFVADALRSLPGEIAGVDRSHAEITTAVAADGNGADLDGYVQDAEYWNHQFASGIDALRVDELIDATNSEGTRTDIPPTPEGSEGEPPPDFDNENVPEPPPPEAPPPQA